MGDVLANNCLGAAGGTMFVFILRATEQMP